jgi:hypothetical protein
MMVEGLLYAYESLLTEAFIVLSSVHAMVINHKKSGNVEVS